MLTSGEIRAAMNGNSIGCLTGADRRSACDAIARSVLGFSGVTIADGIEELIPPISASINSKVLTRYPYLRDREIELALQAGTAGEWGISRRVNPANVVSWIEAYVKCDARMSALKQIQGCFKSKKAEDLIPVEEKARLNREARITSARQAWEDFKRCGHLDIVLDGFAAMVCDYLIEIKRMKPSQKSIDTAFRKSRKRAAQNRRDVFASIGRNPEDIGHPMDWETKRELLEMFFQHLKSQNEELNI